MVLAPDSSGMLDSPPGAGILEHAGKYVSSKFYPALIASDPDGHLIDSRPEYFAWYPPQTNAVNRESAELFNASATAIVRVRGIWLVPTALVITTAAQIVHDINKISTVGSTGSTVVTIRKADSNYPGLDAGITARYGSTAGATLNHLFFQYHGCHDELNSGGGMAFHSLANQLPAGIGKRVAELVLRQNEGVQVKQPVSPTTGLSGALIYFVTD
jgi:hypothetical protein